jgi:hypothetical protein
MIIALSSSVTVAPASPTGISAREDFYIMKGSYSLNIAPYSALFLEIEDHSLYPARLIPKSSNIRYSKLLYRYLLYKLACLCLSILLLRRRLCWLLYDQCLLYQHCPLLRRRLGRAVLERRFLQRRMGEPNWNCG